MSFIKKIINLLNYTNSEAGHGNLIKDGNTEARKTDSHAANIGRQTNYIALDIEIAKIFQGDFSTWKNHRPLGIICAATLVDGQEPYLWYSRSTNGAIAEKMCLTDLTNLVSYLQKSTANGWKIITWNGLGFDFDVIAEESGCWEACADLALNHIDMMFHVFCLKGYPVALDKVAKRMGLPGKLEGMSGEEAPILWQQGQYQKVLHYVAQDARTTMDVTKAGMNHGKIWWTSNRGNYQEVNLRTGWKSVCDANNLPSPDTSWMTSPIRRSQFLEWTRAPSPIYRSQSTLAERNKTPPDSISQDTTTNSPKSEQLMADLNKILSENEIDLDDIIDYPEDDEMLRVQLQTMGLGSDYKDISQDELLDEMQVQLIGDEHYAPWYNGKDGCGDSVIKKYISEELVLPSDRGFSYAGGLTGVLGCPCPVCCGTPNLDLQFQQFEIVEDPRRDWEEY